ncbi:hypothetical protein B0T21DRAFT_414808 [Apiosordaria backusii]|uniref:Uncharacterized protein n=1 Tax=Apiosordaria backusii TaxID=314023 RepID=A0AA40AMZ8_9PEZI|nr:hypothetical protein B0T21DRAFT_414808 [Apiosordaria backusii]
MALTPEIEAILRSNPGERLLVPPLEWTFRHLELLKFDFQGPEAHEDISHAEAQAKGKIGNENETELEKKREYEEDKRDSGIILQLSTRPKPHSRIDLERLLAGPDDSFIVYALLANYPDNENITFYQANVSRTFLSKFGFPDFLREVARTPPVTPESLIIRHKLIPYKPGATLLRRLLSTLGHTALCPPA